MVGHVPMVKLRTGASRGAAAYYKLIGAVHMGDPVQDGDASLAGPHGRRDARLARYAGAQHRTITPEEFRNGQRQDSPPEPLELQERPEAEG